MDGMGLRSAIESFEGTKVFVTGDTGFKGSWLCLWLNKLGATVAGFSLPPERQKDHFNVIGLDKIIQHTDGDIRDLGHLQATMHNFEPEIVFHLAAQPIVRRSYIDPKTTFDTNVGGSVNLLECVRHTASVKSLVYVTSDKCYQNREWVWGYRENDRLGGNDPYSASKAAAEMVFNAYLSSYFEKRKGFGGASVRAGNVIGGGDWSEDRIIPDCVSALEKGFEILIRSPDSVRPWQHVLEPLSGYLLLGVKLLSEPSKYSGAWNFGPGDRSARTVRELVEAVIKFWGDGSYRIDSESKKPHENTLLQLNCDKANAILGWRSRLQFESAVAKTVEWYKKVGEGAEPAELTSKQIAEYMETPSD